MATFNDYLEAIGALASSIGQDITRTVGIGDKETKTNAKKLIVSYQEYVAGKKGAADTAKFGDWLASDPKAAEVLTGIQDDETREKAKTAAIKYEAGDQKVSAAKTSIFKDGGALFEDAQKGLGGNLLPGLLGLIPLLLSVFGIVNVGGTFGALAIGALTFLGAGALMDENSVGGQAWDWIKEKTGMGETKAKRLEKEKAAGGAGGADKAIELGMVKVTATGVEPLAADAAVAVATGAPLQAAYAEIDIEGKKYIPLMSGKVSEGTSKDGKAVFETIELFDVKAKRLTGIQITTADTPDTPDWTMVVKDGKVVETTSSALDVRTKLSDKLKASLGAARPQADFVSGKTKVEQVKPTGLPPLPTADPAPGTIPVTITASSRTDPNLARTFKGTMNDAGTLTIKEILVQEDSKPEPTAVPLTKARVFEKVGKGAEGAGSEIDPDKLTKGRPAPGVIGGMTAFDAMVAEFGTDAGDANAGTLTLPPKAQVTVKGR